MNKIKRYSILISYVFILFYTYAFVANAGPGTNTGTLENPLKGGGTLIDLLNKIVNDVLVPIGTPIIVIMIIYSGFLFVKAQGNSEKLTDAKNALMWTLIGAAVLLGASVLSSALTTTINEIRQGI